MNYVTQPEDPVGAATLDAVAGATKFNYWMYQQIQPFLKGRVLEMGSGTGNISQFIVAGGFETVLSDYQPAYLSVLTSKFGNNPSVGKIMQIDIQDPAFTSTYAHLQSSFDSICMLNVIEHLRDDKAAVANCRFLLKNNGHLILLAPAYSFLYCELDKNLGHYRRYTTRSLAQTCTQHGLKLLMRRYFNLAGIAGWLLYGKILGAAQLKAGQMSLFDRCMPVIRLADRICFRMMGLSAIVVAQK